jgi:hypothetical protein
VFFGREDFPKFSGERRRLSWRLKVEEKLIIGGEIYAKIAFEREGGVLLEPKKRIKVNAQMGKELPQALTGTFLLRTLQAPFLCLL